jgi:hypothetical protein
MTDLIDSWNHLTAYQLTQLLRGRLYIMIDTILYGLSNIDQPILIIFNTFLTSYISFFSYYLNHLSTLPLSHHPTSKHPTLFLVHP